MFEKIPHELIDPKKSLIQCICLKFKSTKSRDSGQELGTTRVQTLQSEESNYGAMNPKSPGLTSILGIGIGLRTVVILEEKRVMFLCNAFV